MSFLDERVEELRMAVLHIHKINGGWNYWDLKDNLIPRLRKATDDFERAVEAAIADNTVD